MSFELLLALGSRGESALCVSSTDPHHNDARLSAAITVYDVTTPQVYTSELLPLHYNTALLAGDVASPTIIDSTHALHYFNEQQLPRTACWASFRSTALRLRVKFSDAAATELRGAIHPSMLNGTTVVATSDRRKMRMAGILAVPIYSVADAAEPCGVITLQYVVITPYRPPPLLKPLPFSSPHGSLIIGHRGSGADNAAVVALPALSRNGSDGVCTRGAESMRIRRSHYGENTLASFCAASAAGADAVEFDVQLTRDGVPVIHHDWGAVVCLAAAPPSASPCTLRVPIGHMTLEEFKHLRPQFMTNGPETNEGARAKRADAAVAAAVAHVQCDGGVSTKRTDAITAAAAALPSSRSSSSFAGHSTHSAPSDLSNTAAFDSPGGLSDHSFCTLAEALAIIPGHTGFNIEMKYPSADEERAYGLRHIERNEYVDRVLDCVFGHYSKHSRRVDNDSRKGHPITSTTATNYHTGALEARSIMFSSFDPDVCWILARKQSVFPVFFLTEGGTNDDPCADFRCNTLDAAVAFALEAGLRGVVTDVTPLVADPSLIAKIQSLPLVAGRRSSGVDSQRCFPPDASGASGSTQPTDSDAARPRDAADAGGTTLALCSYGRANNDPGVVRMQLDAGMHAVICDHVAFVLSALAK